MSQASVPQKRTFSYSEACRLLPEVRRVTERAHQQLRALLETTPLPGPERERAESRASEIVNAWSRTLTEQGLEIKGLWLVDFDNGSGYYCWRYPEPQLSYYHSYEEGFRGRMRIQ